MVLQTWESQSHFSGSGSEGEPAKPDHSERERFLFWRKQRLFQIFENLAVFPKLCPLPHSYISNHGCPSGLGSISWRVKTKLVEAHMEGCLCHPVLGQSIPFLSPWAFSSVCKVFILCKRTFLAKGQRDSSKDFVGHRIGYMHCLLTQESKTVHTEH